MPTGNTCSKCGVPLNAAARHGFCPKCLFEQLVAGAADLKAELSPESGVPDADAAPRTPPKPAEAQTNAGRRFGDYELLEELGRGGIGIVYKARQISLNRLVAVKLLLLGALAGPQFIRRLRLEATSAGCLQHPNIVAIHEVGIHQDQHYLVMDYVNGPNLAVFSEHQPMPAQPAAILVKTLAAAIEYAHERGILHRYLKPSNVLLNGHGHPRITDFGLAKRLSTDDRSQSTDHSKSKVVSDQCSVISDQFSSLTLTGQVIGSPNYMPPEQAASNRGRVGRYSDVYPLGAILYRLVTGRAPFVGESIAATLHQVLESEPASPRLLNPRVPVDLETICLKCLEKELERRYATAQGLADELERFLKGSPILARPINPLQRWWRWCFRHRLVALLLAATIALLLTVAIGSPIAAYRIKREHAQTEEQRRRVVTGSEDQTARVWDTNSGKELLTLRGHSAEVSSAAFSPDDRQIVTGGWEHTAKVWDAVSGREQFVLRGHAGGITAIAFSPAGQRIVTASQDQTIRVWEAATARELLLLHGQGGAVLSVAFSPNGQRIITGNEDHTAQIWLAASPAQVAIWEREERAADDDVAAQQRSQADAANRARSERALDPGAINRRQLLVLKGHSGPLRSAVFSPDGHRIATASDDGTVRVWEAGNAKADKSPAR